MGAESQSAPGSQSRGAGGLEARILTAVAPPVCGQEFVCALQLEKQQKLPKLRA